MSSDDTDSPVAGVDAAGEAPACRWDAALVLCLFFCASFVYLWLRVDASLLYHSFWAAGSFPVFRLSVPFLWDSVLRPGGLLGYVSAFLAQLYCADWSAALTISVVATLLCVASRGFLQTGVGARPRVLHLVTGLVFVWPYNRYCNQLTLGLGVLAALLAAWAYAALPWRRAWGRFGAFLVPALALYFIAGGFCALFAVLCGLMALLSRRRPLLGAACIACGFLIPWGLGLLMAGLFWEEAFVHLLPARGEAEWVSKEGAAALYAACLLLALVPPVWRALRGRRWLGAFVRFADSKVGAACGTAVLALCTCAGFWFTLNNAMRGRMRVDVLSQQEKWEDLLQVADHLPFEALTVQTMWDVNRALHRTGRLGDQMFKFPQGPATLLPVTADFIQDVGRPAGSHAMAFAKSSRLLLDLGLVNEAEHTSGEALEILGRRPGLLEPLFWTNVVKGRTGVALRFLRLLAQDPIRRAHARRLETQMRQDPLLLEDPEVQRLRAAVGSRLANTEQSSLRSMLTERLAGDPGDRMVSEYLMAYYLVTKQVKQAAEQAVLLAQSGVSRLPRHYEEAVLVYENMTGKPVDLGDLEVSEEARMRSFAFLSAKAPYRGDRRRAMRAAAEFRDSYFFYFTFIHVPES